MLAVLGKIEVQTQSVLKIASSVFSIQVFDTSPILHCVMSKHGIIVTSMLSGASSGKLTGPPEHDQRFLWLVFHILTGVV